MEIASIAWPIIATVFAVIFIVEHPHLPPWPAGLLALCGVAATILAVGAIL